MKGEFSKFTPKRKSIVWVYDSDGNIEISGYDRSIENGLKEWYGGRISHGGFMKLPDGTGKGGINAKLNETGSLIWELCDGTHTVEEIIEKLAQEYDITKREAEQDVISFLTKSHRFNLIDLYWRCIE